VQRTGHDQAAVLPDRDGYEAGEVRNPVSVSVDIVVSRLRLTPRRASEDAAQTREHGEHFRVRA